MKHGEIGATPEEPVSHNPVVRKRVVLRAGCVPTITQVARARFPPGEVAPIHQHPDMWELFICEEGAGTIFVAGQTLSLVPGSWVLVEPGDPHELRADQNEDLVVTTFGAVAARSA